MTIVYEELREAVAGPGVGIRARTELEPLGGAGDKVFPPTYGVDRSATTKYATEERIINGERVPAVVLDSVASQANRGELALLDAHRRGELSLPLISVDFRSIEGLEGFDRISSLEAPHRVFDAILRDSLLGDTLFRMSDLGRAITEASAKNAAAVFHYAPTTLLFGGWDSTGPKGGRGAKYERVITSEVVGLNAVLGKKTASRIDPLGIEMAAGPIFEAAGGGWTLDTAEATKDSKGQPVAYQGGGDGPAGRPSHVNHGNVTPSIDGTAGGVTVERIVATTVISFAQLRRLRFPTDVAGTTLADGAREGAAVAARTALAALGLAATVLAFEEGFDLRSRCVLAADGDLVFELLRRGSAAGSTFSIDRAGALSLLAEAAASAASAGLPWAEEEILLQPVDRLVKLVRESINLAATTGTADE